MILRLALGLFVMTLTGAQVRPRNFSPDALPETSFTCEDKTSGSYYADIEADCQLFHVCVQVSEFEFQDFHFLCPNDTVFDQQHLVCTNWFDVDCQQSLQFIQHDFGFESDYPDTVDYSDEGDYEDYANTDYTDIGIQEHNRFLGVSRPSFSSGLQNDGRGHDSSPDNEYDYEEDKDAAPRRPLPPPGDLREGAGLINPPITTTPIPAGFTTTRRSFQTGPRVKSNIRQQLKNKGGRKEVPGPVPSSQFQDRFIGTPGSPEVQEAGLRGDEENDVDTTESPVNTNVGVNLETNEDLVNPFDSPPFTSADGKTPRVKSNINNLLVQAGKSSDKPKKQGSKKVELDRSQLNKIDFVEPQNDEDTTEIPFLGPDVKPDGRAPRVKANILAKERDLKKETDNGSTIPFIPTRRPFSFLPTIQNNAFIPEDGLTPVPDTGLNILLTTPNPVTFPPATQPSSPRPSPSFNLGPPPQPKIPLSILSRLPSPANRPKPFPPRIEPRPTPSPVDVSPVEFTPVPFRDLEDPFHPSFDKPQKPFNPLQSSFNPAQSFFSNPEQPAFSPEQPSISPEQPSISPEQPSFSPEQPSFNPEQPSFRPEQPSFNPEQPSFRPEQPSFRPNQPSFRPEQPSFSPELQPFRPEQPSFSPEQQPFNDEQPLLRPEQRPFNAEQPSFNSEQPSNNEKEKNLVGPVHRGKISGRRNRFGSRPRVKANELAKHNNQRNRFRESSRNENRGPLVNDIPQFDDDDDDEPFTQNPEVFETTSNPPRSNFKFVSPTINPGITRNRDCLNPFKCPPKTFAGGRKPRVKSNIKARNLNYWNPPKSRVKKRRKPDRINPILRANILERRRGRKQHINDKFNAIENRIEDEPIPATTIDPLTSLKRLVEDKEIKHPTPAKTFQNQRINSDGKLRNRFSSKEKTRFREKFNLRNPDFEPRSTPFPTPPFVELTTPTPPIIKLTTPNPPIIELNTPTPTTQPSTTPKSTQPPKTTPSDLTETPISIFVTPPTTPVMRLAADQTTSLPQIAREFQVPSFLPTKSPTQSVEDLFLPTTNPTLSSPQTLFTIPDETHLFVTNPRALGDTASRFPAPQGTEGGRTPRVKNNIAALLQNKPHVSQDSFSELNMIVDPEKPRSVLKIKPDGRSPRVKSNIRTGRKFDGTEKVNGTEETGREVHGRSLDLEDSFSENLIKDYDYMEPDVKPDGRVPRVKSNIKAKVSMIGSSGLPNLQQKLPKHELTGNNLRTEEQALQNTSASDSSSSNNDKFRNQNTITTFRPEVDIENLPEPTVLSVPLPNLHPGEDGEQRFPIRPTPNLQQDPGEDGEQRFPIRPTPRTFQDIRSSVESVTEASSSSQDLRRMLESVTEILLLDRGGEDELDYYDYYEDRRRV